MSKTSRDMRVNEMAGAFLKLFYPIHYQFGKAVEDAMRDGKLTRKQVAILWLIHSEDIQERGIARKELQRLIESWFEISRPVMTQTLRAMARPPLSLVRLAEAPNSGREQIVSLTPRGKRQVEKMVENGQELILRGITGVPEEELKTVLSTFQSHLSKAVQRLQKPSG